MHSLTSRLMHAHQVQYRWSPATRCPLSPRTGPRPWLGSLLGPSWGQRDAHANAHTQSLLSMGKNPWKCYNLLSLWELLKTLVCRDSSSVFGIYVCFCKCGVWQLMWACANSTWRVRQSRVLLAFGIMRVHHWSSCLSDDFHLPSNLHEVCEWILW